MFAMDMKYLIQKLPFITNELMGTVLVLYFIHSAILYNQLHILRVYMHKGRETHSPGPGIKTGLFGQVPLSKPLVMLFRTLCWKLNALGLSITLLVQS